TLIFEPRHGMPTGPEIPIERLERLARIGSTRLIARLARVGARIDFVRRPALPVVTLFWIALRISAHDAITTVRRSTVRRTERQLRPLASVAVAPRLRRSRERSKGVDERDVLG